MPASNTLTAAALQLDTSTLFEHFVQAHTLKQIQALFYQICVCAGVDPTDHTAIYSQMRRIDEGKPSSKAQKLWAFLDKRRNHVEYGKQTICANMNVLVIGAGPCGLRAAIEAALLGAKVVLVEQRDKFSRNNVLHLWEFVIQDLKSLGAKIFYPKFCTGSIEHISIRQLQCILTKVALCLGVQIHDGVGFSAILEPTTEGCGWRASFEPHAHLLSEYEFDVLIGADGKRNTLSGFPRQVVRGKLAIGITANFVNRRTAEEEKVPEISGVAYIFNQSFFKEMQAQTGVDLENIVYYKDETHYFVMCAKKQSLLAKGVIKNDFEDINLLLSRDNVDQEMLCKYALQAADFATGGMLPQLDYSSNHRGQCDIAMFDFTALYSAVHSTRLIQRKGHNLVVSIVGDSLHEPFWPTGSGCARGFLGVFDTAWMLRSLGLNKLSSVQVIAERENVLKLLAQTTKENMHKAYHKYTINPKTRYQTIARSVELAQIIESQIDSDQLGHRTEDFQLAPWNGVRPRSAQFDRKYRLLRLCQQALAPSKIKVVNFKASSWADGHALCALVSKFRLDLVNYNDLANDTEAMLEHVFAVVELHFGIQRPCCTQRAWANLSDERRVEYLERVMSTLQHDPESLALIMSPTLKVNIYNRKRCKPTRVDASKGKKSEQIKRRAGDLMNALASTTTLEKEHLQTTCSSSSTDEGVGEEAPAVPTHPYVEEQRSVDSGVFACVTSASSSHSTVTANSHTPTSTASTKPYTKRPSVDKLNPEIVCKVGQIVNGNLEKDRWKRVYDEKHRVAELKTRRIEKDDLERVEEKLERTALGLLNEKVVQASVSSQEEKVMKLNAADARNFALGDFRQQRMDKFKEIDEKLHKADNLLKFSALSGVNAVTRFREQQAPPPKPKHPPPLPPKPVGSLEERENRVMESSNIVFRTTQPSVPTFHRPMSTPQDLYASVLPRRKNICALCGVEVYLAEQMIIDKLMIHRKCFKCSYCNGHLSLGNSSLDRALMEEYGPRWYCKSHSQLHPSEKVGRILKNENRMAEKRASVAIVPPSTTLPPKPMLAGEKPSFLQADSATASFIRPTPPPVLDSPTLLAQRTMDRMAARQTRLQSFTPEAPPPTERVEFECYRNRRMNNNEPVCKTPVSCKKSSESSSGNEMESSLDDEDADFIDASSGTSEEGDKASSGKDYTTTEDEFDEEDVWGEFEEVLENTLSKSNVDAKEVSDQQAIKWIDTFNKRAALLRTPKTPETVFFTPKAEGSPPQQFFTPATTLKHPGLSETRMKSFELSDERADETLRDDLLTTPRNRDSSSSGASYTTVVSTIDEADGEGMQPHSSSSVFDEMPSMQRATLQVRMTRQRSKSPPPPPPTYGRNRQGLQETPKLKSAGLLSRIFGPESSPKSSKIGASESQKEASMLDRMKRLRMRSNDRRATVAIDPLQVHAVLDTEQREREIEEREKLFEEKQEQQKGVHSGSTTTIEITNVSPSSSAVQEVRPRNTDSEKKRRARAKTLMNGVQREHLQQAMASVSPVIAASPKNIKRVQRQAEKILRRQEHERQRTAQDVQRGLDETENRIGEVNVVGAELEGALDKDPQNVWLLENWLLYVQELRQLRLREEDLKRRVSEISIGEEYRRLRQQLEQLQAETDVGQIGPHIEMEKELMNKIVRVLDEHQKIRQDMDASMRQARKTVFDVQRILDERERNFKNFEPVFTGGQPPQLDIFC